MIYFKIPSIKFFFKKILFFSHSFSSLGYVSEQNVNDPWPCDAFSLVIEL